MRSFKHAWRGLRVAFRAEQSFRIQSVAALAVVVALFIFPLSETERWILLVVTMFILVLELLNSSIERMADLMKPRLDEHVAEVKDLMAGAVLLASCFAFVIGWIIFWPYLSPFLHELFRIFV
ncbi:MAG: diacylglycerol kinase [Candidatus Uhrbacteria bacterium]|nr:diacylglycerol kinase [Candidatus Uhrbacteria bacterium]